MDNSYFIFTDPRQRSIQIERFHICTWEFANNSALIEFGFEINARSLKDKSSLDLTLFIPWFENGCSHEDFYSKLKESDNSRFIFNDSIVNTQSFDGGRNFNGVVHEFSNRNKLCILPIVFNSDFDNHRIGIHIDLSKLAQYNDKIGQDKPNVYVRFSIKPNASFISTRKRGISKSTILYDIKLNERRNIPESFLNDIGQKEFCDVLKCFCFNIVPNNYDLVFFDSSSLINVRTLEYEAFSNYLADKRIKKDDLIVIFNKKEKGVPFSFFSIYSKERIGAGQFALAILINFVCGIFLFIPAFRKSFVPELKLCEVWNHLPIEIYIALGIAIITLLLFIWPPVLTFFTKIWLQIKSIFTK